MDRRTLLALLLTAIVIILTPRLFPGPRQTRPAVDTAASVSPDTTPSAAQPIASTPSPSVRADTRPAPVPAQQPETIFVRTPRAVYGLVNPGGTPASVVLPEYRALRPGAARQTPVNLLDPGARLFHLILASSTDTIALDTVRFRAEPQRTEGRAVIQTLTSVTSNPPVTLTYRFSSDSFVTTVEGAVPGSSAPRNLLITLPTRIRSEEADVADDTRHLAIAFKPGLADVENVPYRDLDSLRTRVDTGAIRWVAGRNKYFVVAAIPTGRDSTFKALFIRGGPQVGRDPSAAYATVMMPTSAGRFAFRIYAGPQSWDHLRTTAPDLENVNPYGGFAHGLVQPFATIVMRMILWMRHTFNVSYGWVLVIFGVMVRIALWPLNQNAMRSSMKMQRIQPQLAEIQKKYRENPEKQRDAMMKLYAEHGMSPFTPILGCLPMLLPMPILFALYFVFQNTIELRGVSFWWLPDLSLKDPYYITPLFMGASMFVLSWIGMRGMPPSPQSKMMSYVMPVMFTVLFWNFASGLNLYYAVQNVAALPQQWLLSRERTGAKKDAPRPKRE